jgi:predicted ribosome quality control (RQC) complex YloA/Tae2 family protein
LSNGRLVDVTQHGFDRIITLHIDTASGIHRLVIEMFRDGNVILLNPEGIIIQPLTSTEYASRILKRGEIYEWPPAQVDPREIDSEDLEKILNSSEADLVRTLAAKVNLGRGYANAICSRVGIEPSLPAKEITPSQCETILKELSDLLQGIEGESAFAWAKDAESLEKINQEETPGEIPPFLEVAPVDLAHLQLDLRIDFQSISEAADRWWGAHDASAYARREMEKMVELGEAEETAGSQLGRRAEQQEGAIEAFQIKAEKSQQKAQSIIDNYDHVNEILEQVRSAIQTKGWEDVKASVKQIKWIQSINPAERTMMVFLPNQDGDPEIRIELHVEETVHQNSQRYFAIARTLKDKSKGAEKALQETERKQRKEEKKRAKDEAAGRVGRVKRAKRIWFERHRWTMLSDGRLMVGGRDAKGNDAVVKKHLGKDDIYVHADLHGAPSCSIRISEGFQTDSAPNPTLPEHVPSLRLSQSPDFGELSDDVLAEAAQIAICWSRAWGSGSGAATAFHVRSTQVSKTAETGESLGRGAFVIRGQRTWHRNLPTELTLGVVAINGIPLPLVGTHSTVSTICERWVRIQPGIEKKESVANKIAKATGLVQDDVLGCLPPGSLSIIEDQNLISIK